MDLSKHIVFFRRFLTGVLPPACEADQVRVVLCYFALFALETAGQLDTLSEPQRDALVAWIIRSQFVRVGGLATDFNVACVYAALASLAIIGRGLDLVPTDEIVGCIAQLQIRGSSTEATRMHGAVHARLPLPAEADTRYVYAAAAVSSLLGRWDGLDAAAAAAFVARCQTYEGGFGLCPGLEAHGGSTYCALATLDLLGCSQSPVPLFSQPGRAFADIVDYASAVRWLSLRTVSRAPESYLNGPACDVGGEPAELSDADPRYQGGLSGRAGKPADACYAWWVGAARLLLQRASSAQQIPVKCPMNWTERAALAAFLARCQFHAGGCGKDWEALPDPLHSCYGVVGSLRDRDATVQAPRCLLSPRSPVMRHCRHGAVQRGGSTCRFRWWP